MDCLKMKVLICLMLVNSICILTTKRKIKPLKKILKSKTESIHETKIPPAVESDQARKFIIRTNGRSLNVDNHNGLYIDYSHPYFPFGHTTYAHPAAVHVHGYLHDGHCIHEPDSCSHDCESCSEDCPNPYHDTFSECGHHGDDLHEDHCAYGHAPCGDFHGPHYTVGSFGLPHYEHGCHHGTVDDSYHDLHDLDHRCHPLHYVHHHHHSPRVVYCSPCPVHNIGIQRSSVKVKLHDHIHDNDASDDADVKYSFETSDVSSGAHRVTSKEKRSTTNSNEPQKRDFSIKVEPGDISDGTSNGFNDRDDNPSDDNSDGIEQEDDEDDMKRFGEKNPLEEPSTTTMEKRSINISSKPIKRSDLTKIIKQVKKVL